MAICLWIQRKKFAQGATKSLARLLTMKCLLRSLNLQQPWQLWTIRALSIISRSSLEWCCFQARQNTYRVNLCLAWGKTSLASFVAMINCRSVEFSHLSDSTNAHKQALSKPYSLQAENIVDLLALRFFFRRLHITMRRHAAYEALRVHICSCSRDSHLWWKHKSKINHLRLLTLCQIAKKDQAAKEKHNFSNSRRHIDQLKLEEAIDSRFDWN